MQWNAYLPPDTAGSPSPWIGQLQQFAPLVPVLRNVESKALHHRRSPGGQRGQRRRLATRTPWLPPADEQTSRCTPESRKCSPDDTVDEVARREWLPVRSPCRKRRGSSPTSLLTAGYKI